MATLTETAAPAIAQRHASPDLVFICDRCASEYLIFFTGDEHLCSHCRALFGPVLDLDPPASVPIYDRVVAGEPEPERPYRPFPRLEPGKEEVNEESPVAVTPDRNDR